MTRTGKQAGDLSRVYRLSAAELPPFAVDARVLAVARRSVAGLRRIEHRPSSTVKLKKKRARPPDDSSS